MAQFSRIVISISFVLLSNDQKMSSPFRGRERERQRKAFVAEQRRLAANGGHWAGSFRLEAFSSSSFDQSPALGRARLEGALSGCARSKPSN